jgi:predicted dehydrogenase
MSKSDPVRFGILGCGGIGRWHAKTIRSLPELALVAVADSDPAARGRAADAFQARACTPEEILERPEVEALSVCTPPHTHVGLIEAAARAGKHVLVEKPLALNLPEADRALAACAAGKVTLGVVHQHRARSATRALRELIARGGFGRPLLATATHTWYRAPRDEGSDGWRGDSRRGGGVLLDQAVHAVDLLIWFLGEPRWVGGATAVLAGTSSAEDTAAVLVGFDGGALATLAASSRANRMRDDTILELAGTGGGFRLELRDHDHAEIERLELEGGPDRRARALSAAEIERLVRGHQGGWREGPRSTPWRILAGLAGRERGVHAFRSPRAYLRRQADRVAQLERGEPQGHAGILAGMAAAVRGKGPPLVTGEDARASIAVIEAIERSSAAGSARVELAGRAGP